MQENKIVIPSTEEIIKYAKKSVEEVAESVKPADPDALIIPPEPPEFFGWFAEEVVGVGLYNCEGLNYDGPTTLDNWTEKFRKIIEKDKHTP